MRWAPQSLFDLCVRTNMGQNETSNTVASSCLFFFLLFHSLCTFFFSKLSSVGLRVSGAPQPGCGYVCVCVALRDETWQAPSSFPQTQHSTTLCVARFSSFIHPFFSPFFLLLLLLFPFPFPRSHRLKKGEQENERDGILIRGGGWDKSRWITKGSNNNTCKTQILNLRERFGGAGGLSFFSRYSEARQGVVCLGTQLDRMWLWAQSWQTDRLACMCLWMCKCIPTGPSASS